jgi:hypothetical protein
MCICMYMYAHVYLSSSLCSFYSWWGIVPLDVWFGARLLHCLIAIICTLPLWSFPYLFSLSVESKGNHCIKFFDLLPTSSCCSLTSDKCLTCVEAWSDRDLIPLYLWDCDYVVCVELLLKPMLVTKFRTSPSPELLLRVQVAFRVHNFLFISILSVKFL